MRSKLLGGMLVVAALALSGCAAPRGAHDNSVTMRETPAGTGAMDEVMGLITAGRYDEAAAKLAPLAAQYERADQTDPAAKALFWQGYCYEKLSRVEDALRLYTRVTKTYPQTPAARQASERMELLRSGPTR
jgi:TolA-binding protein